MSDCKVSENKERRHIGLQMYELKIIQFKIDCNFRKKNKMEATL